MTSFIEIIVFFTPQSHFSLSQLDSSSNEEFPPPPPVRSADVSLNDSNSTTQSNVTSECSEAECDREPLVKTTGDEKALTEEEMQKLIERNAIVNPTKHGFDLTHTMEM